MTTIVFIQVHEREGLIEAELPQDPTHEHLHGAIAALGIELADDTFIFIDEEEEPLVHKHHEPLPPIKRGCRIHVSKCRKINVTVHYLEKTEERIFAPGARVKKVKAWAVEKFKLNHHDAAEHVLQLCNSTDRPATDTPLHELTKAPACSMCFDLVPEKRVEG
ncbi:hypothetical protein [Novosphingobium sp.]|uniref:hypothetical protein n=1 Tax=Novosphingobium sp. TaxID=1874826 RepID=UPI0031D75421